MKLEQLCHDLTTSAIFRGYEWRPSLKMVAALDAILENLSLYMVNEIFRNILLSKIDHFIAYSG